MIGKNKNETNETKPKYIEDKFQNREIRSFYQDVKKVEKGCHNRNNYFKTEEEILIAPEKYFRQLEKPLKLLNEGDSVEEVEQNLPEDDGMSVEEAY